jgi:hypothetical protein
MWSIASIVTIGLTPEAVAAPYPAAFRRTHVVPEGPEIEDDFSKAMSGNSDYTTLKRVARGEKPLYHAGSGG